MRQTVGSSTLSSDREWRRDHRVRATELTDLLRAWTGGDERVAEDLVPMVYGTLHRMAAGYMRQERSGHTLQPTALVHEAYLRLTELRRLRWRDRGHFFAMAARVMRRILVESARRRHRAKRGAGAIAVSLDEAFNITSDQPEAVLALHEALGDLAAIDAFKASILELRFFGGLSVEETAETLRCSPASIYRHSTLAKAWLQRGLSGDDGGLAGKDLHP